MYHGYVSLCGSGWYTKYLTWYLKTSTKIHKSLHGYLLDTNLCRISYRVYKECHRSESSICNEHQTNTQTKCALAHHSLHWSFLLLVHHIPSAWCYLTKFASTCLHTMTGCFSSALQLRKPLALTIVSSIATNASSASTATTNNNPFLDHAGLPKFASLKPTYLMHAVDLQLKTFLRSLNHSKRNAPNCQPVLSILGAWLDIWMAWKMAKNSNKHMKPLSPRLSRPSQNFRN